jgi:hypothetical protein
MSNFKTHLKAVSENLRGLTLQMVTANSTIPYKSLKEFGNAVLAEEKAGNEIKATRAWSNNQTVNITSFDHLAELLSTTKVTAVQFVSFYTPKSFTDYLTNNFGTTE